MIMEKLLVKRPIVGQVCQLNENENPSICLGYFADINIQHIPNIKLKEAKIPKPIKFWNFGNKERHTWYKQR